MSIAAAKEKQYWTQAAVDFVRSIGIEVRPMTSDPDTESFLPNISIANGVIAVDVANAFPGDVLHEAAHLAIMPTQFRILASGSLGAAHKAMNAYLEEHQDGLITHPEDPICRAILQCCDPEATAWQYAAGQAIGLPDQWLFPEGAYDGDAPAILQGLQRSAYCGINGLAAAGWTKLRQNGRQDTPVYPKLKQWIFDA